MKLFTKKELQESKTESLELFRKQEAALVQSIQNKTKQVNETLPILEAQIKERQETLAALKLEHRIFIQSSASEIERMEERRRAALAPVELELAKLEERRKEVSALLIEAEKVKAKQAMLVAEAMQGQEDLRKMSESIEQTRKFALEEINLSKRKAEDVISQSKIEAEHALHEKETLSKQIEEADRKKQAANLAEMQVRALMIQADERIEREKTEQKVTDNKRKMLKVAINELKRRGLWNRIKNPTQYE